MKSSAGLFLLLAPISNSLGATIILVDTLNASTGGSSRITNNGQDRVEQAQTFTSSITGRLDSAIFVLTSGGNSIPRDVVVSIYNLISSFPTTSAIGAITVATLVPNGVFFQLNVDFTPLNIILQQNSSYAVSLTSDDMSSGVFWTASGSNPQRDGTSINRMGPTLASSPWTFPNTVRPENRDLLLQITADPTVVPEPSSIALLGVSILAFRRRK